MAYNFRPQSDNDIKELSFPKSIEKDLIALFKKMQQSYSNFSEYITLDLSKPGYLNILRDFDKMVNLSSYQKEFKSLNIKFGNGTPPKSTGPTTQQQELVTLLIFENLLSSSKPKYKTFAELLPEVLKLYPTLAKGTDWYKSFEIQFNEIRDTTKLPSNKFKVYNRDKGFMDFITGIVKDFGISKKDSWNPADIWLIESTVVESKYKKIIKESVNVEEINAILKDAFVNNKIVGISLKKNNGKKLQYELVNLKLNYELPEVKIDTYKINLDFDKKKKEFTGVTSNLWIQSKNKKYNMGIKSNQSGIGNITYEFSGSGDAAHLGKVPKDMLTSILKELNFDMPQHTHFEKLEKRDIDSWNKKIKVIKSKSKYFTFKGNIDDFIDNLILSWSKGKSKDNAILSQIMQFAYILASLNDKQFVNIISDFFYLAQKKGSKFGPFGKLY